MRALAVLLVVAFHAGLPVPGGFTGVDVFFVISGFVITSVLLSDLSSLGRIRLGRFYTRRVKRLGPALALMIVVVAVVGTFASPVGGQDVGANTGAFAAVFAANAYLITVPTGYFDQPATLNPFLHLWTLGVEEQFYVIFPALLLAGWWLGGRRLARGRGRRGAIVAVSLTTLLSFVLAVGLSGGHSQFTFYGSPTRAWEFGAGALLALAQQRLARIPSSLAPVLGVAGIVAIAAGAFAIHDTAGPHVAATLAPVLGCTALLAAGSAADGPVTRALGIRPAVWIGDLSYSWYLWHWPLIVFATALWPRAGWAAPLFAVLSLLPAWLSYRFVENPVRFSPRISGRALVATATVCVIAPIVASAGLRAASRALDTTASMKAYQRSQTPHFVQYDCATTPAACGRLEPKRRVVLVGDSNAGQFAEPVLEAARRAGFDATLRSEPNCPFVNLDVARRSRRELELCRRFYSRTLDAILATRPNLVITAARTDRYVETPGIGLGKPGGRITDAPGADARLWSHGLASTIRRLNDAGIPVVVVHPVPVVSPLSIGDCAVVRILTRSCTSSAPRSAVDRNLEASVDAENRAVAGAKSAWAIDLRDRLCTDDRCPTTSGGTVLYLDSTHLSVDGALEFTDTFYRAILAHARRTDSERGGA